MRIGTRVRYGMLSMMELARRSGRSSEERTCARRGGAVPARALDIAKAYGLSKGYLEGLLAALRRAGLVRAVRGPGGGWVLARRATGIRPLDVYAALEGPTALVPCAEDARLCPTRQSRCRARSLWVAMGRALEKVLRTDTLAQLAGVAPKTKRQKPKLKLKKRVSKRPKARAARKVRGKRKSARSTKRAPRARGKILKAPRRGRLRKSA